MCCIWVNYRTTSPATTFFMALPTTIKTTKPPEILGLPFFSPWLSVASCLSYLVFGGFGVPLGDTTKALLKSRPKQAETMEHVFHDRCGASSRRVPGVPTWWDIKITRSHPVDGRNPRRKPVEVGSLSRYLPRFYRSQVVQDFFHQH